MFNETTIFTGKRIALGITGSIAAYKACTLASHLTQMGALVDVIMTESAARFVTPLTFGSLTGRPVYTDLWRTEAGGGLGTHIAHVSLGREADLLLIAPATANTIAKLAHGLADDLLSVTALSVRCPVVIAPAMDAGMYEAAATQANVATLKERGVLIAGPTTGRMASGMAGLGRFLEPEQVLGHARMALGMRGPLRGRRVVVSAGPTQEPIDPVRFLSNGSSGKQGFAIAQAAVDYGAETILISGPVGLSTPVGVQRIDVGTAIEMQEAVLAYACGAPPAHALIMASAVGDFRPAHPAAQKVKKEREDLLTLPLARNPDILMTVAGHSRRPRVVVGFAAESEDLLDNAREKMARKKLDMIVANNVTAPDAGFGVDTNRVHFLAVQGERDLGLMSKMGVAYEIMEWLTKQDA